MSLRLTYQGMMMAVMAAVALGVILFLFFKKENTREYAAESPKMILAGDSIFAYFQDERSVASNLSEMMGEKVLDASFGGTCLSYCDRDGRLDDTNDCLSMAALTQGIVTGDFRYQENSQITMGYCDYYAPRLEEIKNTDYSKADVIVVEYLLNDYHNAVPVKTGSDKYDEYTYEGALRSVLRTLRKEYPGLRIIVATPTMSWYPVGQTEGDEAENAAGILDSNHMINSHERDFGGGTIDEYIAAQKRVADELNLEYIDLSECYDDAAYTADGVHPNELGAKLIAEYIYGYLSTGEK